MFLRQPLRLCFIARGGGMVTLEGPEETLRVVLIEFPSIERAKAFYDSAEYARTKRLREGGRGGAVRGPRRLPGGGVGGGGRRER